MKLKDNKQLPISIVKLEHLKNKLRALTNCALSENEVDLFNKVLECVENHLVIDNIDLTTLYTLNVFFIEEEITFSYEGNTVTCGNQFHLVTYRMNKIRSFKSDVFMAIIFAEELTHYYWKIFDETIVKYKVVEILNDMYPELTIEMLKKYGMNGL